MLSFAFLIHSVALSIASRSSSYDDASSMHFFHGAISGTLDVKPTGSEAVLHFAVPFPLFLGAIESTDLAVVRHEDVGRDGFSLVVHRFVHRGLPFTNPTIFHILLQSGFACCGFVTLNVLFISTLIGRWSDPRSSRSVHKTLLIMAEGMRNKSVTQNLCGMASEKKSKYFLVASMHWNVEVSKVTFTCRGRFTNMIGITVFDLR